jgi:hypothetical protein
VASGWLDKGNERALKTISLTTLFNGDLQNYTSGVVPEWIDA